MVLVPNDMTHVFKPLDLTVNRSCKAHIRKSTHQWVTNEVQKQLESGKQPENVKIDTKLSIVKPLHGKLVTSFYDSMQKKVHRAKRLGSSRNNSVIESRLCPEARGSFYDVTN